MSIQEKVKRAVPPEFRMAEVGQKFCLEHTACTLPVGHKGIWHVAHSSLGFIEHIWLKEGATDPDETHKREDCNWLGCGFHGR